MIADRGFMSKNEYINCILDLLEERKVKNSKYSQRALARDLGVNPGDLVKIIKGKKNLGPRLGYRLGKEMGLEGDRLLSFLCPLIQ